MVGSNNTLASTAGAAGSLVIGSGSIVNATEAVAIGNTTTVTGAGGVAIGGSAQANAARTTALGQGAQASTLGAIAVGATARATGNAAIAIGGGFLGGPGPTAAGGDSIALGSDARTAAGAGGAIAIGGAAVGGAINSVAVGQEAQATQARATALGDSARATASGALALGANSIADVADTVSVGSAGNERRIVNVAAGTLSAASTDALNGGQLFSVNQRIAAAFGTTLDAGGMLVAPSYTILGTTYDNVGGALGALNVQVASLDNAVTNIQGGSSTYVKVNSTGAPAQAGGADAIALGAGSNASAANAVALGAGSVADQANTVSIGSAGNERRITNVAAGVNATDAVNVGQLNAVSQNVSDTSANLDATNQRLAGVLGGGSAVGSDGVFTTPSYNVQGGAYNVISEAFGALDAGVNANAAAIALLSQGGGTPYLRVNSTGAASSATGADALAAGTGANASGNNALAIGSNATASAEGALAFGLNASSTGINAIAIGAGASATGSVAVGAGAQAGSGGAAFGDGAVATAESSTALEPRARASAANSIAIGSGSVADEENTVSVGTAGNARRITNVAAGVAPSDAATVGQLNGAFLGLAGEVAGIREETRGGIAAVAALAPLIMPSGPGKTTLSFNSSFYRNEVGVGFGLAHRLNTELPTIIHGSYAFGGGSEHIGRVGLAVEF